MIFILLTTSIENREVLPDLINYDKQLEPNEYQLKEVVDRADNGIDYSILNQSHKQKKSKRFVLRVFNDIFRSIFTQEKRMKIKLHGQRRLSMNLSKLFSVIRDG